MKFRKILIALGICLFSHMLFDSENLNAEEQVAGSSAQTYNAILEDGFLDEINAPAAIPRSTRIPDIFVNLIKKNISEPIWINTSPRHTRNIIDLLPSKDKPSNKKYDFSLDLFYNQTGRLTEGISNNFNFTALTGLGDLFLNPSSSEDNNALQATITSARSLLPLLGEISIEERNLGFMTNSHFNIAQFMFRMTFPIALSERNLVTDKENETKISELITNIFGNNSPPINKPREFARIKAGIGDLRLSCMTNVLQSKYSKLNAGFSLLLPTAAGLELDGGFKKPARFYASENALMLVSNLNTLLENVRALLLKPQLGNNGHVALGFIAESEVSFAKKRALWWNRFSFEYPFAAKEKRLILSKVTLTPSEIPDSALTNNPQILNAFENQFIAPQVASIVVRPGNIFSYTSGLEYTINKFSLNGGYNFYLTEREEFGKVYDSDINISELNVKEAVQKTCQQHKVFAEFGYRPKSHHNALCYSLGGDYTVARFGNASNDWTIFAKLNYSF